MDTAIIIDIDSQRTEARAARAGGSDLGGCAIWRVVSRKEMDARAVALGYESADSDDCLGPVVMKNDLAYMRRKDDRFHIFDRRYDVVVECFGRNGPHSFVRHYGKPIKDRQHEPTSMAM